MQKTIYFSTLLSSVLGLVNAQEQAAPTETTVTATAASITQYNDQNTDPATNPGSTGTSSSNESGKNNDCNPRGGGEDATTEQNTDNDFGPMHSASGSDFSSKPQSPTDLVPQNSKNFQNLKAAATVQQQILDDPQQDQ